MAETTERMLYQEAFAAVKDRHVATVPADQPIDLLIGRTVHGQAPDLENDALVAIVVENRVLTPRPR